MICLNLRSVMEEIRLVRMASPTRVAEEEALVAALTAPPAHVPLSPWDEEAQTDPVRNFTSRAFTRTRRFCRA